ncbi:hypothetical protein JCM3765_000008 [Sporobolomyces pararoseus]
MPPLQYSRPSQSRRPPFYPLVDPKELEDISVLSSEIGNEPLLEDFDDGSLESVIRWYSELQAVSDWFSLSTTERSWHAKQLYDKLCSPTFVEEYRKAWKALSSQSRKELLLEAFAAQDRRGSPKAFLFSRFHKLVPEFNVIDLIAEDGKGLLDLLSHLRVNLIGKPKNLYQLLIGDPPADAEERCAGCSLTREILVPTVLVRSERADKRYFLSVKEAGLRRFLYCGRCKKVDRDVPYCSTACQKKDWSEHKTKCSTENSHRQVPIISTSHSSLSTDIPLVRRLMMTALDRFSTEYWVYEVEGEPGNLQVQGFKSDDRAQETRIRTAMRSLAFKALEAGDQASIALLAAALYSSDPWLPNYVPKGNKVKPAGAQLEKVMGGKSRIKHFRKVFDITSDSEWSEIMKLGKVEIEKPENGVIKELRDFMAEQELRQRNALLDQLAPHRPEDPESLNQLLRLATEIMLGFDVWGPRAS